MARILVLRSFTDLKAPRRMAWRSTMPNQTSTRFTQEAWGWGEVISEPGMVAQPCLHVRMLGQLDRIPADRIDPQRMAEHKVEHHPGMLGPANRAPRPVA